MCSTCVPCKRCAGGCRDQHHPPTRPCHAGILDIPLCVPHAANPVGPFDPLPDINYTGQYTITVPLTLKNTERLLVDAIHGPEHLVYRSAAVSNGEPQTVANEGQLPGHMWISSTNGTIFRVAVSPDASLRSDTLEEVVFAGPGRVLGFAFDREGGMYLCNSLQVCSALASHVPVRCMHVLQLKVCIGVCCMSK